jgi:large subunit ribosomal protein L22
MAVDQQRQEVRAQAKYVRVSARKARLVADTIRGRSVPEARTILAFTPKAAARDVEKVLRSAVANAEANHGLEGDELVIAAVYADEGPTLKRWRARARGRASSIKKRTCHITVELVQGDAAPQPRRPQAKQSVPESAAPEETAAAPAEEKPKRRRAAQKKEAAA